MAADSNDTASAGDPTTARSASRPSVHVKDAVKSFSGRVVVEVEDLTLGTHPIEGLIGPNGAGKTTLLRMIMHSISLDQGTITLSSDDNGGPVVLSNLSASRMAHYGVVKTNQVITDFEQLTILDSMLLPEAKKSDERSYEIYRENGLYHDHIDEIQWYLDQFDFEDPYGFANSAGEKKLLDVIRCLLLKPRVLLLDEPTAGLPDDIRDQLMELIKQKSTDENMSVVVVEHDLHVIWSMCEYVHFMAEGKVVLQGEPAYIREHETVIEQYLGSGHV
ncbi:MAG: ATP-binding cassette domain-containing protein [Acidimicrobiia bacterium]|jgi:ABC-type branched-subunit amino acid transport system ATPase component